ncbi:MAG: response regulator transcription factor [Bryobacterales bacterium]|nr:response regulator transcription factor [Bryobacterales bacterium]
MQGRGVATISALIVDDESLARDELEYLLSGFSDVEVCGSASNGIEALEKIDAAEPDIVFLDVQMPGLDGLSVIKQVRERGGHQPYFILATAYDQYAVEAFQLEALDYVLKPVEKERLALSVGRAQKWLQERAVKNPPPSLELNVPQRAPALQRTKVLVRAQGRNFIVDANEIIYATIDNGLITVVASNLEGISNYRTIEELQSNLDPEVFWRVHRSYLVNINRIREVIPWFKSSYQLKMDDKKQTEIPVSRVQTKKLRALLKL